MARHTHAGIYAIVHSTSGRRYIGGALDVDRRWREHRSQLRRNQHHCQILQDAWNEHGEWQFVFGVIEECDRDTEILVQREQFWMDRYRDNLFNMAPSAGPVRGIKRSEETKRRMAASKYGNKHGLGKHFHGVLQAEDIVQIMTRYAKGEHSIDMAAEFAVSQATICRIVSRRIWWSVPVPDEVAETCQLRIKTRARGLRNKLAKIGPESVQSIRQRRLDGESRKSIADDYGVTPTAIRSIELRLTYNYVD
jgi:group I intron endonuclease